MRKHLTSTTTRAAITKSSRRAPLALTKSQKAGHTILSTVAAITMRISIEIVMEIIVTHTGLMDATHMVAIEADIEKSTIIITIMEEMGVDTSKMTTESRIGISKMDTGMIEIEVDIDSRKTKTY